MSNLCAWCNRDVMDYLASFNGKDICADCEDEATDTSDTCQNCSAFIDGGNPFSTLCDKCLEVN